MRIVLVRRGKFGDTLLASRLVQTLRNKGYDAYSKINPWSNLVDPSFSSGRRRSGDIEICLPYDGHAPIFEQWTKRIFSKTGIKINRNEIVPYAPTVDMDIDVPLFDIVMVSETSNFTPYRNWNGFADLKSLLTESSLSWIDLSEKKIKNILCLNYVKKCRVFVGLESGVSHYVAEYAANKGIIIQSGYSYPGYWGPYGYRFIENNVPCSGCFLLSGCSNNHECMNIPAKTVLSSIQDVLSQNG